jgi:hypothetical protein
MEIALEFWVELGLKDVFEYRKLGRFLSLERSWIAENLAVPIAQDVAGEPPSLP